MNNCFNNTRCIYFVTIMTILILTLFILYCIFIIFKYNNTYQIKNM